MTDILILAFNHPWYHHLTLWRTHGAYKVAHEFRKQGFSVETVDWVDHHWRFNKEKFCNLLDSRLSKNTKAVAWSVTFAREELSFQKEIFNYIKTKWPNIKHLAGGSKFYNVQWFTDCDLIISGFSELAIPDLSKWLLDKPTDLKYSFYNGIPYVDCKRDYLSEDSLPDLGVEYTDLDFIEPFETLNIEFSRGCIFKCSFCSYPLVGKRPDQYYREINSALDQIVTNYQKWGITQYIIADDTFNDNKEKLKIISSEVRRLGLDLEFFAYVRGDLIAAHDNHEDLYQMGCKNWYLGIESLNPKSIEFARKSHYLGRIEKYFSELKKNYPKDLNITANFLIGLPYDSVDLIQKGFDYIVENQCFDATNYNRLIIVDQEKNPTTVDEDSYISKNYQTLGYKKHHEIPADDLKSWWGPGELLWENQWMNWIDAAKLEQKLKKESFKFLPNIHIMGTPGMMNIGVPKSQSYQLASIPDLSVRKELYLKKLNLYLENKIKHG